MSCSTTKPAKVRPIVAAVDAALHLGDREIDLVLPELGVRHYVPEDSQHGAGGFLKARKTDAGAGFTHARFHRRGGG